MVVMRSVHLVASAAVDLVVGGDRGDSRGDGGGGVLVVAPVMVIVLLMPLLLLLLSLYVYFHCCNGRCLPNLRIPLSSVLPEIRRDPSPSIPLPSPSTICTTQQRTPYPENPSSDTLDSLRTNRNCALRLSGMMASTGKCS